MFEVPIQSAGVRVPVSTWPMCDYQDLCLCRYPNVSPQSFSQHAAIVRVPNQLPYDHSLFWDIRQFCNAKLEQGELVTAPVPQVGGLVVPYVI